MFESSCYIIGAQKAGTTFLASLLDQSPDICVSDDKEPQFFTLHYDRGFDWYRSLYSAPEKVLVEASTTYSVIRPKETHPSYRGQHVGLSPEAISLMKKASPRARIIYLLRHPVDRSYSAILHRQRFSEVRHSIIDEYKADPMIMLGSSYSSQIERYLDEFPEQRILYISSQDLFTDHLSCVNRCLEFLGIAKLAELEVREASKHEGYIANAFYQKINDLKPIPQLRNALREYSSKSSVLNGLRTGLKQRFTTPAPKITEAERAFLLDEFRDEIVRIKTMTGIDFS
ncbi:MAG: sulfotransferase domain-containing protein [Pseudomonadota bacterium]